MTGDEQLLTVYAYHEAGHAVVAWRLGVLPLIELRISADGGACFHTRTLPPSLDSELMGNGDSRKTLIASPSCDPELMTKGDLEQMEKRALNLLGGEMAELVACEMAEKEGNGEMAELFSLAQETRLNPPEPGSDRAEFNELVERRFGHIVGSKASGWISKCESQAYDIVLDNWERIYSLANTLLLKRVMSGEEATEIIERDSV